MTKTRTNKNKRSYDDALASLTEVLSAREKDLDSREKLLQTSREELDRDRLAFHGDTSPSDVLGLNIGGTKISVLRRTLTSIPGSMLAARFSGRWDDSIEKDKDGNFFIDQEYSMFKFVIQYLRDKANGDGKYPLESPDIGEEKFLIKNFYRMVEYYGLTDGLYPIELRIHNGETTYSYESSSSKKIIAKEFTTLSLGRIGHGRIIMAYEVTIGTVKRLQIGWRDNGIDLDENEVNHGAGDINGTVALDLTRTCALKSGTSKSVKRIGHSEGTVVRSEKFGMLWRVNGNPVAPYSTDDGFGGNHRYHVPFISVQGDIEVTAVVYDNSDAL